ncbi:hypothetical protein POY34_23965, partial [Escherichia coli]
VSIKNDGHYFCRAGGNRPDGLNEPVTLNNDVWCKSREVVVLRNLIEQAWGKVLDEDNSVTHLVVYPEVLSLVFDAANTYNAELGVLEQTAQAYIESHGAIERHLGCSDF